MAVSIEAQSAGRIAITGYGREEDKARALAAGFDVHVTKPVDVERLRSGVVTAHTSLH